MCVTVDRKWSWSGNHICTSLFLSFSSRDCHIWHLLGYYKPIGLFLLRSTWVLILNYRYRPKFRGGFLESKKVTFTMVEKARRNGGVICLDCSVIDDLAHSNPTSRQKSNSCIYPSWLVSTFRPLFFDRSVGRSLHRMATHTIGTKLEKLSSMMIILHMWFLFGSWSWFEPWLVSLAYTQTRNTLTLRYFQPFQHDKTAERSKSEQSESIRIRHMKTMSNSQMMETFLARKHIVIIIEFLFMDIVCMSRPFNILADLV